MKWKELVGLVKRQPVFGTAFLLARQQSPGDLRRQVNRWIHTGKIIKLRRGVYMLAEPYAQISAHPFVVANALKKTSYVSVESALAFHEMIPEYVPVTTSVTTRRPEKLETPVGRFSFRHLNKKMFFGFSEIEIAPDQFALVASPEKALLDLLYLTPGSDDAAYIKELRIELPDGFSFERMKKMVERCGAPRLRRAAQILFNEQQQNRVSI
jgi:predicted transcriptional regulator of viral defense system